MFTLDVAVLTIGGPPVDAVASARPVATDALWELARF